MICRHFLANKSSSSIYFTTTSRWMCWKCVCSQLLFSEKSRKKNGEREEETWKTRETLTFRFSYDKFESLSSSPPQDSLCAWVFSLFLELRVFQRGFVFLHLRIFLLFCYRRGGRGVCVWGRERKTKSIEKKREKRPEERMNRSVRRTCLKQQNKLYQLERQAKAFVLWR